MRVQARVEFNSTNRYFSADHRTQNCLGVYRSIFFSKAPHLNIIEHSPQIAISFKLRPVETSAFIPRLVGRIAAAEYDWTSRDVQIVSEISVTLRLNLKVCFNKKNNLQLTPVSL